MLEVREGKIEIVHVRYVKVVVFELDGFGRATDERESRRSQTLIVALIFRLKVRVLSNKFWSSYQI